MRQWSSFGQQCGSVNSAQVLLLLLQGGGKSVTIAVRAAVLGCLFVLAAVCELYGCRHNMHNALPGCANEHCACMGLSCMQRGLEQPLSPVAPSHGCYGGFPPFFEHCRALSSSLRSARMLTSSASCMHGHSVTITGCAITCRSTGRPRYIRPTERASLCQNCRLQSAMPFDLMKERCKTLVCLPMPVLG
jgi:hypothetical protein